MAEKRKILIIDDEVDLVEGMRYQLEAKEGYEVITAHNGVEGLERLKTAKPDLIILDMNMPRMGGIEFYEKICRPDGKTMYPVLVLTARANLEGLFKTLNVDGFMIKPFELAHLFKEIDTIIQKRCQGQSADKAAVISKPKKVLVVEDEEEIFNKIAIAFLNAGYIVNAAKSGIAAFDKMIADTPDLLLVKLPLKDISGDVVVAKFKQMPRTMNIPILLYAPEDIHASAIVTRVVNQKICESLGIRYLIQSTDPAVLLQEAESAIGQA